ncbi:MULTISPECIES: DUF2226 domain-containing protein [Methanobacterium]|uniref:Uncharacterized protein n=1 Tax=Methanobacterium bryantii TaxID=2161 RepID=A0A2A2H5F2_METBR|nr:MULTISPECIES: DUF2226 domain-containing protein [Methanobacterium]OEC88355.1 hypothetical protein A9507_05455 [Methanobacterium sp. A39]PAV04544.1 hypothetical protein ASJ80_06870 [Methanobacterium bryantii]
MLEMLDTAHLCNAISTEWGSNVDIHELKAAIEDPLARKNFDNDPDNENNDLNEELTERDNLLEKYGLKDMEEQEIDELLGSYSRDTLNNKELESMERILSKKIHSAVMSLKAIKKAAVEVFIDYSDELYGIVTIIVEYESKGFLDKIMGHSNSMDAETIEVTQIEISELFNSYDLVENFEINIESF